MIYRRSFLKGVGALFIAPAIVRAQSLMPIKEYMPAVPAWCPEGWLPCDGREISKKFYPDLYAAYQHMRQSMVLPILRSGDGVETVISYKNLLRPNGKLMIAGAYHPLYVPGTLVDLAVSKESKA